MTNEPSITFSNGADDPVYMTGEITGLVINPPIFNWDLDDLGQMVNKKWGEGEGGIVTEASNGIYHGCTICRDYSNLFGNNTKGRTIDSEEEFELAKAEFVAHFNKYHQKLMEEKPKEVRSFKKVERCDIDVFRGFYDVYEGASVVPLHHAPARRHAQHTRLAADMHIIEGLRSITLTDEPAHGIPVNSRVPEYDVAPAVNPAHMDRNSRFRHNLRRG